MTRDPFLMVSGTNGRQTIQLTRDEYIDFANLVGTNFSHCITNVGPVRALAGTPGSGTNAQTSHTVLYS
jgi:hypothetical protein